MFARRGRSWGAAALGLRLRRCLKFGRYFFLDFLDEDFLRGTLPPSRRACESPMAIACLRLLTFLPERPLFKVPLFRSRMAFPTFSDAFLPYRAMVASF